MRLDYHDYIDRIWNQCKMYFIQFVIEFDTNQKKRILFTSTQLKARDSLYRDKSKIQFTTNRI